MEKDEMIEELYRIGMKRISLRRRVGMLKDEIKNLEKEFKKTDKELFVIRSSKEYEEYSKEDI